MDSKLFIYRKQHPKCSYCKYAEFIPFTFWSYCTAKDKLIAHGAAKCELYEPLDT